MPLHAAPETLVVSEIVPSTVVGDGPLAGWRCALVRLGGCNLACSWCDVPHAWDGSRVDLSIELSLRLVHNIVADALAASPRLVLLTGGEPLLQQRNPGWPALLAALCGHGVEIELHTNGTLVPGPEAVEHVHRFVVSPKLGHSGEPTWTRIRPEALAVWSQLARAGKVAFSFVVRDQMDVRTVATLAAVHDLPPDLVWISPEGTSRARVLKVTADVAGAAMDHGFNLATRIGVLVNDGSAVVA